MAMVLNMVFVLSLNCFWQYQKAYIPTAWRDPWLSWCSDHGGILRHKTNLSCYPDDQQIGQVQGII